MLASEGADTVFGVPDAPLLPLYAALRKRGVEHVAVRNAESATHAADGWARATGKVGVSIGTSGLAGTDMIAGLDAALADSVPIICITGAASPAAPRDVPRGRRCRRRQARHQVGRAARRARPGPVGVPRGVPRRPLGPSGTRADRPPCRRPARHLPLRPRARRPRPDPGRGRRSASPVVLSCSTQSVSGSLRATRPRTPPSRVQLVIVVVDDGSVGIDHIPHGGVRLPARRSSGPARSRTPWAGSERHHRPFSSRS